MYCTAAKKLPLTFLLFARTTPPGHWSEGIRLVVRVWPLVLAHVMDIVHHTLHHPYSQTNADHFLQTATTVAYCINCRC